MILHSFTGLTTNSSRMIYVLREGVEEEAREIIEKYKITIHGIQLLEAFICDHPHIAETISDDVPPWKDYEPPWPRGTNPDRFMNYNDMYHDKAVEYARDCMKILGTQTIRWFRPDHEDNEMQDDEMEAYESISAAYGRLS